MRLKMKKKFSLVLLFILLFTFFLSACYNPNTEISELTKSIQSLQQQLEELTSEIEKLKEQSDKNQNEQLEGNEQLKQQLQELTDQIDFMQKQLENLTGEPIAFTAEEPVYGPREREETVASFTNRGPDDYDAFADFYNYCQNNIGNKLNEDFYILNPGDNEIGWLPYIREKDYYITAERIESDGTFISPMISEYLQIYDKVLGDATLYKLEGFEGGTELSFVMQVYLAPVPQDFETSFAPSIEFGNKNTDRYWKSGIWKEEPYFNIYLGQRCIGTCYYYTNCYISKTWFEKYLFKNLIRKSAA